MSTKVFSAEAWVTALHQTFGANFDQNVND